MHVVDGRGELSDGNVTYKNYNSSYTYGSDQPKILIVSSFVAVNHLSSSKDDGIIRPILIRENSDCIEAIEFVL